MCPCGCGVQDVRHLVSECEGTREILRAMGLKLVAAAERVSTRSAEKLSGMSDRRKLITVLHMTWAGRSCGEQRRMVKASAQAVADMLKDMEAVLEKKSNEWVSP